MRAERSDEGRYAEAEVDVPVGGGSIEVGCYRWDGDVHVSLRFTGPRGGWRGSSSFDHASAVALRRLLLGAALNAGRVDHQVEDQWGGRVRIFGPAASRVLVAFGPRGRTQFSASMVTSHASDLAAALRFVIAEVTE